VAAIAGIDPVLYEAAHIDGASRWKQYWSITLPSIMPTIIMLLVLKVGTVLNVGFEKIYLLYNPTTYEVADVLSTYIYRLGIEGSAQGLTTAIGLLNSVISFILLFIANAVGKRITDRALF
ncbi:MAG: ABC transporter permease subunit, partial [Clostridiales bacterium]|nr:ABC transporter permease subunit [Clostridiales bacterium]